MVYLALRRCTKIVIRAGDVRGSHRPTPACIIGSTYNFTQVSIFFASRQVVYLFSLKVYPAGFFFPFFNKKKLPWHSSQLLFGKLYFLTLSLSNLFVDLHLVFPSFLSILFSLSLRARSYLLKSTNFNASTKLEWIAFTASTFWCSTIR